jgi:hypothetical protein
MGEVKVKKCTVDLVSLKLLATTKVTTVFGRRTSFLPELLKLDGLIHMSLKDIFALYICIVLFKVNYLQPTVKKKIKILV